MEAFRLFSTAYSLAVLRYFDIKCSFYLYYVSIMPLGRKYFEECVLILYCEDFVLFSFFPFRLLFRVVNFWFTIQLWLENVEYKICTFWNSLRFSWWPRIWFFFSGWFVHIYHYLFYICVWIAQVSQGQEQFVWHAMLWYVGVASLEHLKFF